MAATKKTATTKKKATAKKKTATKKTAAKKAAKKKTTATKKTAKKKTATKKVAAKKKTTAKKKTATKKAAAKKKAPAKKKTAATKKATKKAGGRAAAVLKQLESLGDERMRAQNKRFGAGDNQFGVRRGDQRKVAKGIKQDHELAIELWETGNIDARFVAILAMDPKQLTAAELDRLVRSVTFDQVMDWLLSYVVKDHADKEALRVEWMAANEPMALRAGWSLTAGRVAREPKGIDHAALLDRIESEMGDAHPSAQWTMNVCLTNIGIYSKKHRKRAIAIAEEIGLYRDYPVSKGCTSPFAPIWIAEMVKRQQ